MVFADDFVTIAGGQMSGFDSAGVVCGYECVCMCVLVYVSVHTHLHTYMHT